jgi:FlaG/FlaF family flagellin (archaellin)
MRSVPVILGALALMAAVPARADRPVTNDERAKLVDAVSAEGCSGGEMEFDETKFEVEAQCNDGRTYDLEFDASYRLITKKLEE